MKYLVVLLLVCSFGAFAKGSSRGGKIVHVASVREAILFSISGGNQTNRPACATTRRFSVHKDSVHAPIVLTAFSTGKELAHVQGLGSCTLWQNSEDIEWIEVCPISGC